jgi:hypothetical protein
MVCQLGMVVHNCNPITCGVAQGLSPELKPQYLKKKKKSKKLGV